MWETLAENGGAVLGLAISIYTVYSFAETRIERRRKQYAFLRNLHDQLTYFVNLSRSLSQRAKQAMDLYREHYKNRDFPSPAAECDELPEAAEAVSRWLVQRAEHLNSYPVSVDLNTLGEMLTRSQIDALLELENQRRIYLQVLSTRTMDLRSFPRKRGVLARFADVTHLNIAPIDTALAGFATSIGFQSMGLGDQDSAGEPDSKEAA
jgi:hypothetical protein